MCHSTQHHAILYVGNLCYNTSSSKGQVELPVL